MRQYDIRPMHEINRANDWLDLIGPAVVLVITLAIIWVIYKMFMNSTLSRQQHDPLIVAKERYARGEITKEQLGEIRKEIAKS